MAKTMSGNHQYDAISSIQSVRSVRMFATMMGATLPAVAGVPRAVAGQPSENQVVESAAIVAARIGRFRRDDQVGAVEQFVAAQVDVGAGDVHHHQQRSTPEGRRARARGRPCGRRVPGERRGDGAPR